MQNEDGVSKEISLLKRLAKEYLMLPDNARIENYNEKIQLFRISTKTNHPQAGYAVFISRRSLKHFVEERKRELLKNHTQAEALQIIFIAIENIPNVINNFDIYSITPPRHLYAKAYTDKSNLRVIVDEFEDRLEICSIHFRTHK